MNGSIVGSPSMTYRQTEGFMLETQHFPRSSVRRRFSASRPTTRCRPCRTESGQLFRHVEPRMTRRLAIDAGSDFPALFQIKTRRLKMDGRQHRTRAAAPPCFVFCHGKDSATKTVAPQAFGQKELVHSQQAERRAPEQSA